MKPVGFIDNILYFEKKTKEKFVWRADYNLTIDEDGSFVQWKIMGGVLFIAETCGDSKKWWQFLCDLAILNGVRFAITFTRRGHKAFCKRTDSKVLYNFKDEDGRLVYCLFKEVG